MGMLMMMMRMKGTAPAFRMDAERGFTGADGPMGDFYFSEGLHRRPLGEDERKFSGFLCVFRSRIWK